MMDEDDDEKDTEIAENPDNSTAELLNNKKEDISDSAFYCFTRFTGPP